MPTEKKGLSRRDFLHLAGLAGLGLPVGALAANQGASESQSEELTFADEAGRPRRPWWVKQVDMPTTEVDWARKSRFNAYYSLTAGKNLSLYLGEEQAEQINQTYESEVLRRIKKEVPGYTLKDFALLDAQRHDVHDGSSFLGPQNVKTPQSRGLPPWHGTPEEAARILRVAMRHFGAAQVGFVRLDENTRKLIYSHDRDEKELAFENVPEAYETEEKRVIPAQAQWVIAYTIRMSSETLKRAPTIVGAQTSMLAYSRGRF